MFLTIDIGSSSYKGHILTPEKQYYFNKVSDRLSGKGQPIYIENSWYYDKFLVIGNKKCKESRVYNIRDALRILNCKTDKEKEIKMAEYPFLKCVTDDCDVIIEVKYHDKKHEERMSKLLSNLLSYILENVGKDIDRFINRLSYIIPYDYTKQNMLFLKRSIEETQNSQVRFVDERFVTLLPYIYYGGIDRQDSYILLIDCGDSCTTVSIAHIYKGKLNFLLSDSLFDFCGKAFDRLLLKYIILKYYRITNTSLLDTIQDIDYLLAESERAKIELSSHEYVELPFQSHGGLQDISIRLQEFETIMQYPLQKFKKHILTYLQQCSLHKEIFDYVITVGGNAEMPCFQSYLRSLFPYADHDYGLTIQYPSILGSSLLATNMTTSTRTDPWCYRIFINESNYIIIGMGLQVLTKDVLFYPIAMPKKGTAALIRIIVERCKTSELTLAMSIPYKEARNKGLWQYVFGYHYVAEMISAGKMTLDYAPVIGASNHFTYYKESEQDLIPNDCLEVTGHYLQNGHIIVSLAEVFKGFYVPNKALRFSFYDGKTVEIIKPHNCVVSERDLFKNSNGSYISTNSAILTSLTSSSVLPKIYHDHTVSRILEYSIKNDKTIPQTKKELLSYGNSISITCPNRALRIKTLPTLINQYPSFLYPQTLTNSHIQYDEHTASYIKTNAIPPFMMKPCQGKQNTLLYFVGDDVKESPFSVCCYSGQFHNDVREGTGKEFSLNHSVIYKGNWEMNLYNGIGTLWLSDGSRIEGSFKDGYIEGNGKIFNSDNVTQYEGMFVNGKKEGHGKEYMNSTIYDGEFKNDMRNGKGYLYTKEHLVFEGNWVNNKKHGYGKEIDKTTVYEGEYKNNYRHGKGKLCLLDNQVIYDGEWKYNKKHGKGKEVLKGGIEYIGEYKDNYCEGKGKQYQNNILLFDGEFKKGYRDGYGIWYYDDGKIKMQGFFKHGNLNGSNETINTDYSSYIGEVIDSSPNGHGHEVYKDGSYYDGNFKNGIKHGEGMYYNPDGELIYNGHWYGGHKHGYGEGRDESGLYRGYFINDKKCGFGTYTLYSGDCYKGDFVDDIYNGKGELTNLENRTVYDGNWRGGQRNGEGKLFFGNGEYYHGCFVNDMMCGKGIHYYENGMPKYVGEFRNDMRNGEGIEYTITGDILEKGFYVNNERIA